VAALPGLHVLREEFLGVEASHDLDPLHLVIDVSGLDITGYDAADWLREHQRIDMGLSDHRRIEATLSLADDDQTTARLVSALAALTQAAAGLRPAPKVDLRGPVTWRLSRTSQSRSSARPATGQPTNGPLRRQGQR
jgi:arginine decarboxylase